MAAWVKCKNCSKVKQAEEFDEGSAVCRTCLTAPVKTVAPRTRASGVTTRRVAPKSPPAVAEIGPRAPLLGVAGSGDLEVRERRARRVALDQLAETHAEDFEHLLQQARRSEGLRS